MLVHGRNARERGRRQRHAVITFNARDDFFLLRLANGIVVIANQLHRRVVRLRSRIRKQDARHRHRRPAHHDLNELCYRAGDFPGKRVVIGQLLHLPMRSIHQTLLGKPQRSAPETGHTLNVLLAVFISDMHASPTNDHKRPIFFEISWLGIRVKVKFRICLGGEGTCHALSPSLIFINLAIL